ncbi:MAG: LPS export ABC transporter permease LptF [Legionella sp.]
MLIFRYLAKEVFITLVSLTTILMLIFMSNQFVRYLNRAASGQIPAMFIMKLMMLELPNLMGFLLPLGFYVAILVAYGRLYAENEMTVLQACGYGPVQLLRHSLTMAVIVASLVAIIIMYLSPYIAKERATLLRSTGLQTMIQTLSPGEFREFSGGQQVFYVETMNNQHTVANNVFLARLLNKNGLQQWDILWADNAFVQTDNSTSEKYVSFNQGQVYQGVPGQGDYQITAFKRYQLRLPHPIISLEKDIRTAYTSTLWPINNSNLEKAAELQWRLSIPLMVLILTLVAVPLSRVNSRVGKFAKLLPAIILYIIYANFMFITRGWLSSGKISLYLGMWWLHAMVALLGLGLFWRNYVRLS